jgi:AraC-like DNA-binding protein
MSLALQRLATRLAASARLDGRSTLGFPGAYAVRQSVRSREPAYATLGPAVCIAAQGAKAVMLGHEVIEYDPANVLVFSVGLPIAAQVIRASREQPYLGLVLELDPARVAVLAARVYPRGLPKAPESKGLFVTPPTDALLEAAGRLVDVAGRPDEAHLIGPLLVDEILIRLLRSPVGPRIALMGRAKSGVHSVARAIALMRTHFAQPIRVEEIARSVRMSPSAFFARFKAVTSLSPIQYQKVLRLHEARRLMLFQEVEPGEASRRVGYLSASQFSREYARFFGSPPTRDLAYLRASGF